MSRYRVTIFGADYDAMADLVRKYEIAIIRHSVRRTRESGYSVDAMMDTEQIRILDAGGYKIERHEDVDAAGKARQAEVGEGSQDKGDKPKLVPHRRRR